MMHDFQVSGVLKSGKKFSTRVSAKNGWHAMRKAQKILGPASACSAVPAKDKA